MVNSEVATGFIDRVELSRLEGGLKDRDRESLLTDISQKSLSIMPSYVTMLE